MKIKSIKKVEPRTVYAVKTSTGTYIADGLAHHNCAGCNVFKYGEQYLYSIELDRKYGSGTAKKLMARRHESKKWTIPELEEIISDCKEQIRWYESNESLRE
jgi:hypothetical protein